MLMQLSESAQVQPCVEFRHPVDSAVVGRRVVPDPSHKVAPSGRDPANYSPVNQPPH